MFTYRFGINVGISLYSMALLVFIYISVRRQTAEYTAHPHRQKSFLAIIVLTFALIVSDIRMNSTIAATSPTSSASAWAARSTTRRSP